MPTKYRIKVIQSTMALFWENGRHIARPVPAGAVINAETLEGNMLVEVQVAGQTVRMFPQDIRARGEVLDADGEASMPGTSEDVPAQH